VPAELLSLSPSVPKEVLLRRLAERITRELGFSEENALWAVVSWGLALSVFSPDDARAFGRKKKRRTGPETPAPAVSTPAEPAPPFPPESVIVSPAGDGHARTIAEALGKAASGARVFIRPGVYRETIRVEKPVELFGDGPVSGIVLEGTGSTVLQLRAETFSLHGVTIRGTALEATGAPLLEVLRGTALIEDCTVSGGNTGISLAGSRTRGVLRRLQLTGFRTCGILVSGRATARLDRCRVASSRTGIELDSGSEAAIHECHIEGGHYGIAFGPRTRGTVEGTEVTKYVYAGILVRDGADPAARKCTVHHGNFGIEVSDRGKGDFAECDVAGNARGFFITRSGNPLVRRCAIHDGQFGVGASEKGKGVFEDCRITGNLYAGVSSRGGAHPRLVRCQVTGNRDVGVWVYEKSQATVEGCDLSGNSRGPFTIEAGSKVSKKDIRE